MPVLLEDMKGPQSPIYPTSLFLYEGCPQQFLWKCGWEGIDLGDGPGRRKLKPSDKDQHHALMGTVIQRATEDFYNLEMWRKVDTLESDLHNLVKQYMLDFKDRFVLIGAPSIGEMNRVCMRGTTNFLKTAKAHKLVAVGSKSEENIMAMKNDVYLGAKIDFIIPKKDGLYLLDGKNSQSKMKYLKPDQLRFYSMTYEAKYGKRPDKLGFLWYRYPYNEETGEEGIEWITCTDRDIQGLEERTREAHKGMVSQRFHPTPTPKICMWCDYESVCSERQAQKKVNAAKRKKKSLPVLPGGFFSMVEDNLPPKK